MSFELLYETPKDDHGNPVPEYPIRAIVFEIDEDTGYKSVVNILECKSKRAARYILNKRYSYGKLPRAIDRTERSG